MSKNLLTTTSFHSRHKAKIWGSIFGVIMTLGLFAFIGRQKRTVALEDSRSVSDKYFD